MLHFASTHRLIFAKVTQSQALVWVNCLSGCFFLPMTSLLTTLPRVLKCNAFYTSAKQAELFAVRMSLEMFAFPHQCLQCLLLCSRSDASLGDSQYWLDPRSRVTPSFPQDPGTLVLSLESSLCWHIRSHSSPPGHQLKVVYKLMQDAQHVCCSAVCLDKSP